MKKLIAMMLVLAMFATVLAACGKKEPAPGTTAPETTAAPDAATVPETTAGTDETVEDTQAPDAEVTGAALVLQNIWDSYLANVGEDMLFPAAGGDMNHSVMDGAGMVDVKDTDYVSNILNCPAELHAQIDDIGSLMHMMNANTFTSAAYHVVEGTDLKAFVNTMAEGIKGTQWMCGFPDQLVVATVDGENVVVFYGALDLVNLFKEQLTAAYADAEIVIDESLA